MDKKTPYDFVREFAKTFKTQHVVIIYSTEDGEMQSVGYGTAHAFCSQASSSADSLIEKTKKYKGKK